MTETQLNSKARFRKKIMWILFGFFWLHIPLGIWIFSSILMKHIRFPFQCTKGNFYFCGTPEEQKLVFEKISFKTRDQFLIRGWWIPAKRPTHRAIIFSHGRGADRREGMRLARPLHRAGFHLLTFDYRHCGRSQKSFNSMGFHERKDLKSAVEYVQNVKRIRQIGVMGFSMGAAIAIRVTATDPRIRALIVEGGYAHVEDVIAERARTLFKIPRYPFLPPVMSMFAWRTSSDFSKIHPIDWVGRIAPRPLSIIHGGQDSVVQLQHARRLFRAARGPKSLWIVPDGGHIDTWQKHRAQMERHVVSFFQRHLTATTSSKP